MKKTIPTTYILRTVNADLTAYNGFVWPRSGPVSCPDWDPKPECGNGLHGLAQGEGNYGPLSSEPDALWMVVRVRTSELIKIDDDKVKFPRGTVIYCGDRLGATNLIKKKHPASKCVYAHHVVLDAGAAISGDYGTSTSGDYGTSTSGDRGTSTSGDRGTSTSGYWGTSTSGYWGTSISGNCGTSTSGDYGTGTSGYDGTSTSGDYGTSTSGHSGTSISGNWGTSTSGDGGTSTSGQYGTLIIKWWDGNRYRSETAYVGENGIEPNVAYKLDGNHKFVKAI
jgi:hypothetical protein